MIRTQTGLNTKILFFTSPIGLGHASRDIAIAEKLVNLGKDKESIHFITGKFAFDLISSKGYLASDRYKPREFSIQSGQLHHSFNWLLRYYWYYRKCRSIVEKTVKVNNKVYGGGDLIVSDEDFASIVVAEKNNHKRILITDIMETHFTNGKFASMVEKKLNRSMQKMMSKCNYIIIPDYGSDADNIVHVGPIVRDISANRNTLRKEFGFNKKTIVVSTGGTNAGKYLIKRTIEAYKKLKKKFDIDLVIVSGPAIKMEPFYDEDIRSLGFIDNLHECIYASDLVVSLAGRSTMDESIVYGVPGIFIPIKNHFEQEQGAKRLGYKFDDIFRLERLIEDNLSSNGNNGSFNIQTNIKGAEKAAKLILETL
ncbi:MAG: UDP-glucuronosyltransferase [Thermoproteota archaeon]|nr:UDP-glucuronosyltransferase [Thermoproteota archaeon]